MNQIRRKLEAGFWVNQEERGMAIFLVRKVQLVTEKVNSDGITYNPHAIISWNTISNSTDFKREWSQDSLLHPFWTALNTLYKNERPQC